MIMSTALTQGQHVARTTQINSRIGVLGRLLDSVGFVNVDIRHDRARRQVVIVWRGRYADARRLLYIIDPTLEEWRWPVLDIWHGADTALGEPALFCQVRIDIH